MAQILSAAFPNVYLRMDASGVTAATDNGSGRVNCQFGAGLYEQFQLASQPDGTVAIASVQFPGVYLRLDGSGVTTATDNGSGVVNCQLGLGPYEKFRIESQPDGTVAIASVQFPGVYLRMNGSGVSAFTDPGGGMVNCQFGVGPYEKFKI